MNDLKTIQLDGKTYGVTPASHAQDKNDPHEVTPEQIGAAPAGYGLGGQGKLLNESNDLDDIWETGNYRWDNSIPAHSPSFGNESWRDGYAQMRVDGTSQGEFVQTVWSINPNNPGQCQTRHCYVSLTGEKTVTPWGWKNPPMLSGVEYRTTERWQGKAVYTMLVDCGYFPAEGSTNYTTIDKSITSILRVNGTGTPTGYPTPYADPNTKCSVSATIIDGVARVILYTEKGIIGDKCIVQLWYTKD